jgi:hypothetical protein
MVVALISVVPLPSYTVIAATNLGADCADISSAQKRLYGMFQLEHFVHTNAPQEKSHPEGWLQKLTTNH